MKLPSSKRFFIPKGAAVPLQDVGEWLDGIDRGADDCTLAVTLKVADGKRRQKKFAFRQLEELAVDNEVATAGADSVWMRFGYQFSFIGRKYYWNGREIHVTANEQVFLYRCLVLHDDTCTSQMYYLKNMRKRLGKEFLSEVTCGQAQEGGAG